METNTRLNGTVKWYSRQKGYGFISGEDDTDYYVHHTKLNDSKSRLKNGQKVTFVKGEEAKGHAVALDVVLAG